MNNKTISISTAEKEIMEILWEESPMDAGEIVKRLTKKKAVHPNTVKTLLSRLVKKQAVAFHEKSRKYHYYPTLDKQTFYEVETDGFLSRFFNGEVSQLVSHFAAHEKLSKSEIEKLKQLINTLEKDNE